MELIVYQSYIFKGLYMEDTELHLHSWEAINIYTRKPTFNHNKGWNILLILLVLCGYEYVGIKAENTSNSIQMATMNSVVKEQSTSHKCKKNKQQFRLSF